MSSARFQIGFVSLGCPKNLVDTENMIQCLSKDSFVVTGNEDEADVVVINTCGFLEPAKNESMDTIGEFSKKKKAGQLKGVIVAGCMTERYLDLMQKTYPEVDGFIRTGQFSQVSKIVRAIRDEDSQFLKSRLDLIGETPVLEGHSELTDFVERDKASRPYAYVKIAEGCNRTCTFCIIPKLRGKLHSRSIDGVVDEIKQLVASGVKEIIFIAQDLTSYGRDRADGANLLALLKQVEMIEGLEWYRLMYNYPRFFTDELITFLASSDKFSRYLDIPFQHISDSVLKKMRRPEKGQEIRDLVRKLRDQIPGVSLRTTLMVGFPGETEEEFDEVLDFVREAEFNHLGAFTYYREKDTPSYDLENQVPEDIKKSRYERLMSLQAEIQEKVQTYFIGETVGVMIDGFSEKTKAGYLHRARHYGQAPEIDGMTYLLSEDLLENGQILPARILKTVGPYDLLGELDVDMSMQIHVN